MGNGRAALIAGVHAVKNRKSGKDRRWYIYAWRGGPQIMLGVGHAKPKLDAEALVRLSHAQKQSDIVPADTLAGLIRQWWPNSPDWKALAPNTQRTWASALSQIENKWGETPIKFWSNPQMVRKVVEWRDSRSETPRGADNGVNVLKALLSFARLRGFVTINVADNIPKLYRGADRAEIIWSNADIAAFVKHGPQHIVDGLQLATLTGLRRDDLVSLTWDEVQPSVIVRKALKVSRGKRWHATVPIIPELDVLLEMLRTRDRNTGVKTVLVNSQGNSWSGDGFGGSFNKVRDLAGIVHSDGRKKHLHDVRGTFATKLFSEGVPDADIANIMAWSPEQVAGIRRVYVDQSRVIVAIAERIKGAAVKRSVKQAAK
jgi:integrase